MEQNTQTISSYLKDTFDKSFKYLINKFNIDSFASSKPNQNCSIWYLNESIIPIDSCSNNSLETDGATRLRYFDAENYENIFDYQKLNEYTNENLNSNVESDFLSVDFKQIKVNLRIAKNHVHTFYAFDQTGRISVPLVIYPKTEPLDVPNSFLNHLIRNTTCVEDSQHGDFNSLDFFLNWIKLFAKQQHLISSNPIILITNPFIYMKISSIYNSEDISNLKSLLKENNIYLLFYSFDDLMIKLNQSLTTKLDDLFEKILLKTSQITNPNNQLSFLFIFKQTLRQLVSVQSQYNVKETFNYLVQYLSLEFQLNDLTEQDLVDNEQVEEENTTQTENEIVSNDQKESVSYKLNDSEIDEYCELIDELSRIGSLCIKFTYLRDLYSKFRPNIPQTKEVLASEKRWIDLIKKNKSKFKYTNSIGLLSEADYQSKCFDLDYLRAKYFNLVKHELKYDKGESVWTFDILHFPYVINSSLLKQPEKDFKERPRNLKPRISVLFAYNSVGDYLQPYFIYPQSFNQDSSELSSNECLSHNGYVTCRIFENWLFNLFLPYVKDLKSVLLLYCGKLALLDKQLLKKVKNHSQTKLTFFALSHENLIPFNFLFKKNLRKRQTDLFLDSWRKVTSKLNLSYQFKCKSRQQFFNIFMDAFQNCIEEIGSSDSIDVNSSQQEQTDLNNSSVEQFKNKMSNSFEICKLWPVLDEDYKEHLENYKNKCANLVEKIDTQNHLSINQTYDENVSEEDDKEDENVEQEEDIDEDDNEDVNDEDETYEPTPKRTKVVSVKEDLKQTSDLNKSINNSDSVKTLADVINKDEELQTTIKELIKEELTVFVKKIESEKQYENGNDENEERDDLNNDDEVDDYTVRCEKINDDGCLSNGLEFLIKDLLFLLIESNRKLSQKGDNVILKQLNKNGVLDDKKFDLKFKQILKKNKNSSRVDLVRSLVQDLSFESLSQNENGFVVNKLKDLLCNFYFYNNKSNTSSSN